MKISSRFLKADLEKLRRNYRKDLVLNRYRLEEAGQEQATVFEKWYAYFEEVESDIRDFEHTLGRLRSSKNLSLRSTNPDVLEHKYGFVPTTESGFNSLIDKDPKVRTLDIQILKLKRVKGVLKGAVEAARMRKSMIRVLDDTYRDNYWDKTTPCGTPRQKRRHKE